MCQTDFTGLGETSSTGHCYRRNGVVRVAERAFRDEPTVFAQLSGNRMNLGRFQTLSQREGRKYRWQTLGKHGLTAARRTDEKYVVAARSSYLQGSFHIFLSFYFCKVEIKVALLGIEFLAGVD